jgi:hypothetical protein
MQQLLATCVHTTLCMSTSSSSEHLRIQAAMGGCAGVLTLTRECQWHLPAAPTPLFQAIGLDGQCTVGAAAPNIDWSCKQHHNQDQTGVSGTPQALLYACVCSMAIPSLLRNSSLPLQVFLLPLPFPCVDKRHPCASVAHACASWSS